MNETCFEPLRLETSTGPQLGLEIRGCGRRRKSSVKKRRQIVEVKRDNMSQGELGSNLRKDRRFSFSLYVFQDIFYCCYIIYRINWHISPPFAISPPKLKVHCPALTKFVWRTDHLHSKSLWYKRSKSVV